VAGYQVRDGPVDFDFHISTANGVAHAVTCFRQSKEFDFRDRADRELEFLRLADVEIDSAK